MIALAIGTLSACEKDYTCECVNQTTGSKAGTLIDEDESKVREYCDYMIANPPSPQQHGGQDVICSMK